MYGGSDIVVGGAVKIPFDYFNKAEAERVKRDLTFRIKAYHRGEEDHVFTTYFVNEENGTVTVPYAYALKRFQNLMRGATVHIAEGQDISVSKLPDPLHPAAPPNQEKFFNDLEEALRTRRTTLALAPTGSGKTVAALYAIGRIRKTALIILPSKELKRQWDREIKLHLGLGESEIGSLVEGRCFYRGKKIVTAVIHNVYGRRLSHGFKNNFGIVGWDEAHRLGAETFGWTFNIFPARARFGLTATPERKDGCSEAIYNCFGEPSVIADTDALPCQVRVVKINTYIPNWSKMSPGTLISILVKDLKRNLELVKIIKTLYRRGRNILVLSDRVQHLQLLMSLCTQGNDCIDKSHLGLYTRTYNEGKSKKTASDAMLDEVRENARVIFSTYGMGKEAIDIKRLDAGLDASPRSDGIQQIGRIRRPCPDKELPIWFTPHDYRIPILDAMTGARIRDYQTSETVEVIVHG